MKTKIQRTGHFRILVKITWDTYTLLSRACHGTSFDLTISSEGETLNLAACEGRSHTMDHSSRLPPPFCIQISSYYLSLICILFILMPIKMFCLYQTRVIKWITILRNRTGRPHFCQINLSWNHVIILPLFASVRQWNEKYFSSIFIYIL